MCGVPSHPITLVVSDVASSSSDVAKWSMSLERVLALGCSPDAAWGIISAFGGLHHWLPNVEVCDIVEGHDGVPGCIRYVAGGGRRPDGSPERWVFEKLLDFSPSHRSLSYIMLDSSYGFKGYVAHLSVRHANVDTSTDIEKYSCQQPNVDDPIASCSSVVSWRFEIGPVPHRSEQEVFDFFITIFNRMMVNLESTILTSGEKNRSSLPPPNSPPYNYWGYGSTTSKI